MVNARDELPKQIGPYKIIKRLGAGGMGTVYRAVHEHLHREVALKVLQPTVARNEAVLSRFRSEARASAMPAHENIVNLYENGEADGYHFLALEYVNGKDLLELIDSKGPLPVGFSIHIVRQAVKALQHASKHGFVHRDIKPSNFLITREKVVKLTDMGLARKLEEMEDDRVTRDGTTVGTVDYMAPEQGRNSRDADIRSDIYSLGCTWYHMLTGETPYPGGTALERLYKHEREPRPDVRAKNEKVPEDIAAIIAKMMSKQPEDRYQTPIELLDAIDKVVASRRQGGSAQFSLNDTDSGDVQVPRPKEAPPTPPTPVPGPRWTIYLASGLALAVVVGGILFFASRSESPVAALAKIGPPAVAPAKSDDTQEKPVDVKSPDPGQPTSPPEKNIPVPPVAAKPAETKEEKPQTPAEKPVAPVAVPATKPQEKSAPEKTVEVAVVNVPEIPLVAPTVDATAETLDDNVEGMKSAAPPVKQRSFQDLFGGDDLNAEEKKPAESKGKSKEKKFSRPRADKGAVTPVIAEPYKPIVPKTLEDRQVYTLTEEENAAILGPWYAEPLPPLTKPNKTSLVQRSGISDENGVIAFNGLKPAWNDSQAKLSGQDPNVPGWLTLHTDGPIFDGSHPFDGRPFVVAADPGFVPTLVYEEHKSVKSTGYWFEFLDNGRVEIEGVHFLIYADDIPSQTEEFDILRAIGSDLILKRCSFTILGRHPGINVVRIRSGKNGTKSRVLMQDCVIRSEMASALTIDSSLADVLIDNCCFISRDKQLLRVQSPDRQTVEGQRNIRIVSSTLVSRSDILRVRIDGKRSASLAVSVANSALVWNRGSSRRPMVQFDLFEGATNIGRVRWSTIKSVFVGWPALAAQSTGGQGVRILAKDAASWQKIWGTANEQELVVDDKVAGNLENDFLFQPYPLIAAGPWEFTSDATKLIQGYDPSKCLAFRPEWFETVYGNFEPLLVGIKEPVRDFGEFPFTQQISLNLGEKSLTEAIRENPDATRLEVSVQGAGGEFDIEPIALKGVTLVLRFPAPRSGKKPSFTLTPKGEGEALFDIIGGSLEIENAEFVWPKGSVAPSRFARVKKGDLRLKGCRIQSSLLSDEDRMSELIRFDIDPLQKEEIDWRRLELINTMLVSSAPLVTFEAPAAAVVVYNCLMATQKDAFRVLFGEKPISGWRGFIEVIKTTISASDAAFHLYPYPNDAPLPARPFVIAMGDSILTDVIDSRLAGAEKKRTGAVVSFEGDSLDRGLVAWQGSNNAYDRLLSRLIRPASGAIVTTSGENVWLEWLQAWGRRHDPFALTQSLAFKQKLKLDRFNPDCFALADDDQANVAASDEKAVGARISDFGGKLEVVGRVLPRKIPEEFTKGPIPRAIFLGKETAKVEGKTSEPN